MDFDSEFDSMSPINPVVTKNTFTKKPSNITSNIPNKSKPNVNKSSGPANMTDLYDMNRVVRIFPVLLMQIVFVMILKNILDIRKRCKCRENKDVATVLIVLYSLLLIVYTSAIVAILIGYSIEKVKTAIPAAMAVIFIITIILTYAYIYKVERKCDCEQTENIYNLLKMYFGVLGFIFFSSILVFAFSFALD